MAYRQVNSKTSLMAGRAVSVVAMLLLTLLLAPLTAMAQRPRYDKLSPMLRRLVRQEAQQGHAAPAGSHYEPAARAGGHGQAARAVCAFVKIADGGEEALQANGCRVLTQVGDICIASIPTDRVSRLSLDSRILRIEANCSTRPLTDSLAWYLGALPVYDGQQLPQAYTGRGVVVGVMDIGFDLTHPNFYSRDTTDYRIRRFWDMLSADTVGSTLYVGRDYAEREELLAVAHARDGLNQTHGTHTLGIAAGSGYDSPYRGMAPESDICLVANAVSADLALIDTADYYKYTFATDALGFKYIFDYAESQGKPCVINFSEGSGQDFWGYDLLYYEMLERLTGPGRIIVSAAGNYGADRTYMRKEAGRAEAGAFFRTWSRQGLLTLKADADFDLRLVAYHDGATDTLTIGSRDVLAQKDSVLQGVLMKDSEREVQVAVEAYPSCYVEGETCYDITFTGKHRVGTTPPLSFEVIGTEATVEAYTVGSYMAENSELNPLLTDGERSHSILSPASSPGVICVGATYYRPGIVNYQGQWKQLTSGDYGEWCVNSSVGPTYDGRTKPDVMAPGINIISSYSSYYLEQHPDASDISWDVAHFDFEGRTYAWNSNSGTSMAAPAVAGAIALWLQARPDLTTEQVLDVFSHTCRHHDPTLPYPNNLYGYGEIDVYRGLLYLLGVDGIKSVSTTPTTARITIANGRMTIDLDQSSDTDAPHQLRIYSLEGKQLFSTPLTPDSPTRYTIQLPRLPKGVCVVQLDTPSGAGSSTLLSLP